MFKINERNLLRILPDEESDIIEEWSPQLLDILWRRVVSSDIDIGEVESPARSSGAVLRRECTVYSVHTSPANISSTSTTAEISCCLLSPAAESEWWVASYILHWIVSFWALSSAPAWTSAASAEYWSFMTTFFPVQTRKLLTRLGRRDL